jgi:hypothetical protein
MSNDVFPRSRINGSGRCRSAALVGAVFGCLVILAACGGGSPKAATVAVRPPADRATDVASARPTISGPSNLQLRPVLATPGGSCPAPATYPEPARQVVLPGPGNTCYRLGPSALTVSRAAVTTEPSPDGTLSVGVTLSGSDVAGLDRVAAANLDHQVAVVMFGRALNVPIIRATRFNGAFELVEIDPQTAADIEAALRA